jgi:hypothetical protein
LVSKSNDGAWILTPTSGVEAGDVTSHQVIAILLTSGHLSNDQTNHPKRIFGAALPLPVPASRRPSQALL